MSRSNKLWMPISLVERVGNMNLLLFVQIELRGFCPPYLTLPSIFLASATRFS